MRKLTQRGQEYFDGKTSGIIHCHRILQICWDGMKWRGKHRQPFIHWIANSKQTHSFFAIIMEWRAPSTITGKNINCRKLTVIMQAFCTGFLTILVFKIWCCWKAIPMKCITDLSESFRKRRLLTALQILMQEKTEQRSFCWRAPVKNSKN